MSEAERQLVAVRAALGITDQEADVVATARALYESQRDLVVIDRLLRASGLSRRSLITALRSGRVALQEARR